MADGEVRGRFEASWGVTLDPAPGLRIPNMFAGAVAGEFRGAYIQGEDLAQRLALAVCHGSRDTLPVGAVSDLSAGRQLAQHPGPGQRLAKDFHAWLLHRYFELLLEL